MKSFKDSLRENIPYLQQQKLNQLLVRALHDPNAKVVSRGKKRELEELLEEGAEVDLILNDKNETPLMWVAKNCNEGEAIEKTKILLNKGAQVNLVNKNGDTALMMAAENGYKEVVEALIAKGATFTEDLIKNIKTPLDAAMDKGHDQRALILLKNGAQIAENENGVTAMMKAARHGCDKTVQYLIENNQDINAVAQDGSTALGNALEAGHGGIAQYLLEKGAETHDQDLLKALAWQNNYGHKKSDNRNYNKIIPTLIQKGAGVNILDENGLTPLISTIKKNNFTTAKLLIQNGADVNLVDKDGLTPLMHALQKNDYITAKILIKNGADVNLVDKNGQTALLHSVKSDHWSSSLITKALIKKGANIDVQDSDGLTPLMHTIQKDDYATAKLLIKNGADVNLIDKNGQTALLHNIKNDHWSSSIITKAIIKKGANIDVQDSDGLTPLMLSAGIRNPHTTKLLINNGANIHAVDKYGCTALMHAYRNHEHDNYQTLVAKGADRMAINNFGESAAMYQTSSTAIARAVEFGNKQALEAVINNGDNIAAQNGGVTILMQAAKAGLVSVIQPIIEKGYDINDVDKDGKTALIYAVQAKKTNIIKTLIECGAELDNNVLIQAAKAYDLESIIQPIIEKGYDFNAVDKEDKTALIDAILKGKSNTIETLINQNVGLDSDILTQVVKYGFENLVQPIIEKGYDVNDVDKEGKTALIYAVQAEKPIIIRTLIEHGAGLDSSIFNQSTNSRIRNALIINAALNQCPVRSNWEEIQIGLSNSVAIQNAVTPELAAFLAATLPAGAVQETMFNKLDSFQQMAVSNFINLKNNPDVNCLTEIQQNKIAAFKLGVDSGHDNAMYLAAILPAGNLRNGIIPKYNSRNPKNNLNQEKINALRCFAHGVGETKGFTTEDGKIDYQKAGEVVKELINSKNALNDLTIMLDSRLEMENNFRAAIENSKIENSEIPKMPTQDWIISDPFLTKTIQSHLRKKDSIFNNLEGLKIFSAYLKEYGKRQENNDLPNSPNTTTEHPISQMLKTEEIETNRRR